ncbi:hypothetical protein K474DRAFT_1645141 [Panus rudis PR-1116 ss-1]|nr:hypothetical protein K474DRAFT_1645141 [Panus rudis PR-1116 ss-1]
MISRAFLAKLSRHISIAKNRASTADLPFGGVNVILCGDFHQFPPVATKTRAPLYYESDVTKGDTVDDCLGRTIYEAFTTVVLLTQQVRVSDPVWMDLLHHLRRGRLQEHHLDTLRQLRLTDPRCPATDFTSSPWKDACLVTPRHAVRMHWNEAASRKHCEESGVQLFICPSDDTIRGRPLSMVERYIAASKKSRKGRRGGGNERAGLPDEVRIAKGMKVMVTLNVETDLDIANGTRGEIVDIILDPEEPPLQTSGYIVKLTKPPAYVLVKLDWTRLPPLNGLPPGVVPIEPAKKSFTIHVPSSSSSTPIKKTVSRRQLPITPAYAFTDYRAQGQTITNVIVDIATPPSSELTLFNIYVALSRSSGRQTIRLLRDFDTSVFTRPLDERLREEDERLQRLNENTKVWWDQVNST